MTMKTVPKVALVTGATRGIGEATALALLAEGYRVVGTATTDSGVAAINDRLSTGSEPGVGLRLDFTSTENIAAFLAMLAERSLVPSILVNNAGVTRDNILVRMSEVEWSETLITNLTGVFRLTKALLKPMIKARYGRIINVSSVVARMGNSGQANYVAAKSGLEGFTRSLALELGSRGITVNAIAPGFIETNMTQTLDDAQRARMLERIPMQRYGRPSEIAAVIAFLASDAAAYVTGQTWQVNGGLWLG